MDWAKTFNKRNAGLFIFLTVSFLFSIKYIGRITSHYLFISLGITIFYFILWYKRKLFTKNEDISKKIIWLVLFVFLATSCFIFNKVKVETLNVDRWSVITSYWDSYFNGDYVYFSKSNVGNYPGPMPFYFILALPFYLIGELGFFSILGVFLFYFFIEKTISNRSSKTIAVLLLLVGTPYIWEVICRSNIFVNGTLVLVVLVFFINQKTFSTIKILTTGILIGLVLSTRNVFVIPFIIAFVYSLKKKKITIAQTISISIITISTFGLTFVPFVWNHFAEFKVMNPFIIQSTFLVPFKITILFILAAFVGGFFCKTDNDVYIYSAIVLFGSIAVYFIYWINLLGYEKTFINSYADISYFILCMPFALYCLLKENEN